MLCSVTFFSLPKSCRLWDNVEKYCTAGQATDDNVRVIRRMRYACSMTRAKTHTRNMWYLLLFHGSSGYSNTRRCYVISNIAYLVQLITHCINKRTETARIWNVCSIWDSKLSQLWKLRWSFWWLLWSFIGDLTEVSKQRGPTFFLNRPDDIIIWRIPFISFYLLSLLLA